MSAVLRADVRDGALRRADRCMREVDREERRDLLDPANVDGIGCELAEAPGVAKPRAKATVSACAS